MNYVNVEYREEYKKAIEDNEPVIRISGSLMNEILAYAKGEKVQKGVSEAIVKGGRFVGEQSLPALIIAAGFLLAPEVGIAFAVGDLLVSLKDGVKKKEKEKKIRYTHFAVPGTDDEGNDSTILAIRDDAYNPETDMIDGYENVSFVQKRVCPVCGTKGRGVKSLVFFCSKCGRKMIYKAF